MFAWNEVGQGNPGSSLFLVSVWKNLENFSDLMPGFWR
jgi:hypothetical protein